MVSRNSLVVYHIFGTRQQSLFPCWHPCHLRFMLCALENRVAMPYLVASPYPSLLPYATLPFRSFTDAVRVVYPPVTHAHARTLPATRLTSTLTLLYPTLPSPPLPYGLPCASLYPDITRTILTSFPYPHPTLIFPSPPLPLRLLYVSLTRTITLPSPCPSLPSPCLSLPYPSLPSPPITYPTLPYPPHPTLLYPALTHIHLSLTRTITLTSPHPTLRYPPLSYLILPSPTLRSLTLPLPILYLSLTRVITHTLTLPYPALPSSFLPFPTFTCRISYPVNPAVAHTIPIPHPHPYPTLPCLTLSLSRVLCPASAFLAPSVILGNQGGMATGARASAVTMVAGSDTKLLEQPLIADDVTQLIGKVSARGRAW